MQEAEFTTACKEPGWIQQNIMEIHHWTSLSHQDFLVLVTLTSLQVNGI